MNLKSLRMKKRPKIMIIPMIDIIFFLLVFFMMSTLYMVEQKTLPVELPQAATAMTDYIKAVPITVTNQGGIHIEDEELPLELLGPRIRTELARSQEAAFVIRADKQVEYQKVIAVLDELKRLGVKKVAVATEQKN